MIGIFLDLETNGLDPYIHTVLDIAFCFMSLPDLKELVSFDQRISPPLSLWNQSDENSLKVNGLSWDECQKGNPLSTVAQEVIALFEKYKINRNNGIFICQNPSFDRAFFNQIIPSYEQEKRQWPYHWLDLASMFWAQHSLDSAFTLNTLSKDAIAHFYSLLPERKPHKAIHGVQHLIECYRAVMAENEKKNECN